MNSRIGLAALAALAALAGCSSFDADNILTRKIDYKSAGKQQLPSLEVPPDLTTPARDNRYLVPETGKGSATLSGYEAERKETARTGSTDVLPQVERMRIERAGSERWLVVQERPEKLWPVVKDFWQENGFLITTEVPEAGVMETDWAENRAKIPQDFIRSFIGKALDSLYSTSERDKFRTRLEPAADGKSTEIYISHRGMEEVYADEKNPTMGNIKTVWQPRAPDPGLEAEFLRRLMVRLGAQEEKAKQIAANPVSVEKRAELAGDSLKLFEPFDRAWRRVGLALDRVGFTVEDRDRQKGLYFVRYADPDSEMARKSADRGFLSRLFSNNKDSNVKAEQYRVQVREDANGSAVAVLNKDGASDSSVTSKRILALLHEQLK
ncbi:MAG: outer membrane protein assembly factor BamC [Clostridia bacterium]